MPADTLPPPFLDDQPPPWLARLLATSALTIAALGIVAAILVRVPEAVTGRFLLVPAQGTDPLRAPKEGVVTRVATAPATGVRRGDTLFVLASEPALDRDADRQSLEATLAGGPVSRSGLLVQLEATLRADSTERIRLDARIATLTRSIAAKQEQRAILRDLVKGFEAGAESGVSSGADLARYRLDASRLEDELATAEGELADTRAAQSRLAFDAAVREAEYRERVRGLDLDIRHAQARLAALRATGDQGLVVPSPCDGTVLRLHASAPGAYVGAGDLLADLACSGDSLIVEVEVPASGIGRVRAGQEVRLLYDAFPYERYGVRYAEVTWVGAATAASSVGDSAGFRARARPDDTAIRVDGADRPLVPGMGGTARVVVERRRLIAYAFAPLLQLRESMGERKPRE